MHGATEVALGWAGNRDRADSRGLRRDDIHDDAGRVDGLAARYIQTHSSDRLPALVDRRAGTELRDLLGRQLRGRRLADSTDRLLGGALADLRLELLDGLRDVIGRHPQVHGIDAVELPGLIPRVRPCRARGRP